MHPVSETTTLVFDSESSDVYGAPTFLTSDDNLVMFWSHVIRHLSIMYGVKISTKKSSGWARSSFFEGCAWKATHLSADWTPGPDFGLWEAEGYKTAQLSTRSRHPLIVTAERAMEWLNSDAIHNRVAVKK